jgi:hypothetical protein
MIARFRKKVGDDWFALTVLIIAVIITVGVTLVISNMQQTNVSVDARTGAKVSIPPGTKTSDPKQKTREPDNNKDQPGGVDARQNEKNTVINQFLWNILGLFGVFLLVLFAMTGAITAAVLLWQRWRAKKERPPEKNAPPDQAPRDS